MNEKTLLFKILIVFDYAFNVTTGGGYQTCFSTRAYLREQTTGKKRWVFIRKAVDKIMLEKHHCKHSYYWERQRKQQWLAENKL